MTRSIARPLRHELPRSFAGRTRTALVVDDEADLRDVIQLAFEIAGGWTVLTAASGMDALHVAPVAQPDVVLLDVMMPGLDGPTTLARLRSDPRTALVPVVLLTAKAQTEDLTALREKGVCAIIAKPFDPMTLAERVSAALCSTVAR
jgi:CheY-like chemotaxis protein